MMGQSQLEHYNYYALLEAEMSKLSNAASSSGFHIDETLERPMFIVIQKSSFYSQESVKHFLQAFLLS